MLEIRPNCEHCDKDLPNQSDEAVICSFECTFCEECATKVFKMYARTGGKFTKRPLMLENLSY